MLATVGTDGALGTASIVTVEAASLVHVLSVVLLTVKVYVPGATPVKVSLAWKAPPILYATPACVANTILPVGTPHVG
ncbi:hypothetical protein [Tenacibaculum sp. MAR_2009_124]|uniref:hypothetical protein n=1 Tax=Tenacibaculum sp. MAR_2009_124 TaxID=1250059 RepID=UPI00115F93C2|nr:hypothetical protein [Tenacibaculum sp. MAR_2009_124]